MDLFLILVLVFGFITLTACCYLIFRSGYNLALLDSVKGKWRRWLTYTS